MRRHISVLLAILIVSSAFAPIATGQSTTEPESATDVSCEYPLELTDATGETITLEDRPDSIVALQASDTQTVFEIGAEDRLVGMPYSPATSGFDRGDRVNVGDGWTVNHERVVSLNPDIVLAANATKKDDIDQLRDAGLTVYHFENAQSLEDVRENVQTAGKLTGECDGAEETVSWMDDQLETIEQTLNGTDRPTVYYAMGDGYTAGSGTFIHEALTTAGMENIAAENGIESYGQINPETVVNESPDWIVYPNDRETVPIHESVKATPAYQNDNVLAVNANYISQPAPRVVYAIADIVEAAHPEAYAQASGQLDTAPESGNTSDDDQANDSVPGFGVPVAIVAVLAAVGIIARRR